ncbi:tumor necrosis factor receptor superfamily member 14 isoform X3 [Lutra lutra]|uniref:tumor necrosis factor receptor superfamily member 14 isoform X3 n=1 Tax=Lutra lutra TaxID=9657 RepID=UPI001FD02F2C|nr:tumor necrosis factor receptor superfamily member 14 isoform X3 [Lutra lutra]
MEPPGGWEPPPCSRAPKPDALSQALYLLLLGFLPCALAMAPCKEEEYPVGSECCPKCSPGYRVKEACGELTGTVCAPCDPGTYTAHLNGLSECLQCRVCDPAMGLVTRQKCSQTENTVCVCDQGHFCVSEDGDDCAECSPHTPCRPGQRVQSRGTEWQDRVCEDCPPGTFSPSGTLEECQPWSTCDGPLQTQAEPGTSSSDVTCSSLLPAVVGSVCVAAGVFCLLVLGIRMRRRWTPGGPTKAGVSHQVSRIIPHWPNGGPAGPTRRHHSGYGGDNVHVPWDGMTHLRIVGSWRQTPKPSWAVPARRCQVPRGPSLG